jgi:hypothetical protein
MSSSNPTPRPRSAWAGLLSAAVFASALLTPATSLGCACGCGVFDVGTGALFPDGSGGTVYVEADFVDQNRNWSGTSAAPADANADKRVRSDFYTAGVQYFFNRRWGVQVDVPYWQRQFATEEEPGTVDVNTHAALGDIRIRGVYTGFSPDMSSGLTFGLKLPTGDDHYPNFDPDTEIGSGSTDLLLGGFHRGRLSQDSRVGYFLRGQWQQPLHSKANYRPGHELIGVVGTYFQGWTHADQLAITPILQVTASYRGHDGGPDGHPEDSGSTRVLVAPGIEVHFSKIRLYAEAGFDVYDNVSGNQLVSRRNYKLTAFYSF